VPIKSREEEIMSGYPQHATRSISLSVYLFINYVTTIHSIDSGSSYSNNGKLIRITGDIILGGIFPMHEHLSANREYPCGAIKGNCYKFFSRPEP